jgi:muramoyltetrapeptide carboxypeptidase
MEKNKIRYPEPLVPGATIGVTAPSSGIQAPHIPRYELVTSQLQKRGYQIREGGCLRNDYKHVSGSAQERAKDFMDLWLDPKVSAIIPPWGGELLIEILPHLDFEALAKTTPKWVLGYSDTSTLLFALTLMTGIASLHGSNLMDLIEDQVYGVTQTTLKALSSRTGDTLNQNSYPQFQIKSLRYEQDSAAPFQVTETTSWRVLDGASKATMSGRLIGGCLDTIVNLVGTPYGDLQFFRRTFAEDGMLLYLENCELSPCGVARALWNMRLAGWFVGIQGILFGRSHASDANSPEALSYFEAVQSVLGDLGIPVLLDMDIGHRPPQLALINGAWADVTFENGAGSIVQRLT